MKGSHQCADLKQLYASEKGIALRTAQLHAKISHPDWVAYLARTAGSGMKVEQPTMTQALAIAARADQREGDPGGQTTGIPSAVAPAAMTKLAHERTVEEWAECEAWACFVQANEQRRIMMAKGDPMAAVGFVKIAADALKSYHLARAKRVGADIEAGRLKPVAAWHSVKSAVAKIAALIGSLEEIAGAANPEKPMVARSAITDWRVHRFNPQVQQLILEVEGTILAAA